MRENNLLDLNMYESTLSQNVRQPDDAYAERPCSENASGGSSPHFNEITIPITYSYYNDDTGEDDDAFDTRKIVRSLSGDYDFTNVSTYAKYILFDPVKSITLPQVSGSLFFTPTNDFNKTDGIINPDGDIIYSADTVDPDTPGHSYLLEYSPNVDGGMNVLILKISNTFPTVLK